MTIHVLGPFHLDTQDDLLFHGSDPVALGRRATAVLRALVERPGAVIAKDALIQAAWRGQIVEESNLTKQIASLRRVLREAPGGDWDADDEEPAAAEVLEEGHQAPDDTLGLYLRQMGAIPLLSRQEELALAQRLERLRCRFGAQ